MPPRSSRAARSRAPCTSRAGWWSSGPTPQSPYYEKSFAKDKPVILYCAGGGRAALAGQALKEMGYGEVYNLGGFGDWANSGGAVDKP